MPQTTADADEQMHTHGHAGLMPGETEGNLLDLCEPLFLYICRLNRSTRMQQGVRYGLERVRNEVKALLKGFALKSRGSSLARQFERVRLPLIFFVNETISNSTLPFSGNWKPLTSDPAELIGGTRFFDLLDAEFSTRDPGTIDRLTIFYVCLTLGFKGKFSADQPRLDAYIVKTGVEIHEQMDTDETIKICPETYQHTIRRPITEPLARPIAGIGLISLVLIAVAFALNGTLYFMRTAALKDALWRFNHSFTSAPVNK